MFARTYSIALCYSLLDTCQRVSLFIVPASVRILKYIFVLISPHAQCFIPEVNTKLIEYPVVADFCALLLDEQCNCGILTYLIENTDYILNG